MKKTVVLILSLLFCVCCAFALQETYRESSFEVQTYKSLKRISACELPEPTYPIAGDQLIGLLRALDTSRFSFREKYVYGYLMKKLSTVAENTLVSNEKIGAFDASAGLGTFSRFRTSEQPITFRELYVPTNEILPSLTLDAGIWIDKFFAMRLNYSFKAIEADNVSQHVNFYTMFNSESDSLSPYEAWASFGKGIWNVAVGRDRLFAGNSKSGSLYMNDNFLYESFAKASLINKKVSYDFTILAFDAHGDDRFENINKPEENRDQFTDPAVLALMCVRPSFDAPQIVTLNHRISASFFDRLTVSVYESMLGYGTATLADPRLWNPAMIMHNIACYWTGNWNNYFGAEASVALCKGLELNAQLMLDQLQLSPEIELKKRAPNAFGATVGITGSKAVGDGVLDFYAEGIYTSPCLYLRAENYYTNYINDHEYPYYQTDLLVGNRTTDVDDLHYIGLDYGPDNIGVGAGCSFLNPKMSIKLDALYRMHGTYELGDPVDPNFFENGNKTPYLFLKDNAVPEHNFNAGIKFNMSVFKGVDIQASAACVYSYNYKNVSGDTFLDFMFTVGAKIDAFGIGKGIREIVKK